MGLSPITTIVLGSILAVYALVMIYVGYLAQRRITNVEDYVLAGRRLPTSLATITIIATWYGAESLMTVTDEVAEGGIRNAMLDPIGISLCLLLAGLFVAGPLWRLGFITIPDFFRLRYGPVAEYLSALILVPSYFGWIAAQYLALATLLEQFFGVPSWVGILLVALFATSYTLMGGMWSVTWTDAIQMSFIVLGLIILGTQILLRLGDGNIMDGWTELGTRTDPALWQVIDPNDARASLIAALTAVAIGSLGNLPVQDLMQRVCSSKSDVVASRSCLLGSAGYLILGTLPILAGLSASLLLPSVPEEGVVTQVAVELLSPTLLMVFVLAIVSAVLSTIVSAVLAPAAVLAQNLMLPIARMRGLQINTSGELRYQRLSVVLVVIASVAFALNGSTAYELVESSYSLSLVGLFASFVIGLRCQTPSHLAATASMLVGVTSWVIHEWNGWEHFAQPLTVNQHLFFITILQHELMATLLSLLAFLVVWWLEACFNSKVDPTPVKPTQQADQHRAAS